MRIAIVGPGALGSVLAAALSSSGHEIVLIGRPSPHLTALYEHGLLLTTREGDTLRIRLEATDNPASVAGAQSVVVLVKTGDTETAMTAIAPYIDRGQSVLTLQNGLGNAERIRQLLGSEPRMLPGTTSQAATRVRPGEVVHTGEGLTRIGFTQANDAPVAADLAGVFSDAGWPAAPTPDIERWLWSKAAVNAAINGLTALSGVKNGAITADPELLTSAESIAEEAANIARAKGIEVGDIRRAVWETAVATADNRSSMLQDMEAGRRTEVDAIHGAILAAGEEIGVAAPAIRVTAALIKARERQFERADNTNV